jgi:hypothetical protein
VFPALAQPGRRLRHLLLSSATGTDGTTSTASSSSTDEKIKNTMADLDALLGIQEEPAVDESKVGPPIGAVSDIQPLCEVACWASKHAGQADMPLPHRRVSVCVAPVCLPLPAWLLQRIQAGSVNSDAANIELLQSAVTAEVQKLASGSNKAPSAMERDMTDQMVRQPTGCLPVSSCLLATVTHHSGGCCEAALTCCVALWLMSSRAVGVKRAWLCCVVLQQKIVERAKQMTEDDSADRLNQKAALQQEFEQLLNIFFTGE